MENHPGLTVQPHATWLWLGQLIRIVSKLTTLPGRGKRGCTCWGIAQSSWGGILVLGTLPIREVYALRWLETYSELLFTNETL